MPKLILTLIVMTGLLCSPALAEEHMPSEPATDAEIEADKERSVWEAEDLAEEREARRAELYGDGDYRLADPGQRPVSNFYTVPGFRTVDPRCYAGVVTWEAASWIPMGGDAQFHVFEQVRIRPTRTASRFSQRHRWELYSDPLEIMGVVSTSEGSGGGRARVRLDVSMAYGIYRLVTDVRPREGSYRISTAGGGLARSVDEDFFFYFGDHHFSYVDLSGLAGARGTAAGQAALTGIDTLLSTRAPNVFMGYIDWATDVDGAPERALQIDHTEHMALSWGIKTEGERTVSIRIFCDALVRQYERSWGG